MITHEQSFSTGSSKLEDLFTAALEAAVWIDVDRQDIRIMRDCFDNTRYSEVRQSAYEELCGLIEQKLPEGHYFGMHQDDSKNLGIWRINEDD